MPGRLAETEPVAMTMVLGVDLGDRALVGRHQHLAGRRAIEPMPRKAVILFFLNRNSTPETLAVTVSSLCFIICWQVELRRPTSMPKSGKAVARFFEQFGGVQQRLGRNAADVEAGAAEGRPLLDHRNLHAELRSANGGDVAARARADDREVERVRHDVSAGPTFPQIGISRPLTQHRPRQKPQCMAGARKPGECAQRQKMRPNHMAASAMAETSHTRLRTKGTPKT